MKPNLFRSLLKSGGFHTFSLYGEAANGHPLQIPANYLAK